MYTQENIQKTEFKLNYTKLYTDLKLYQIRNPNLNKMDNVDTVINQINDCIEPLNELEKLVLFNLLNLLKILNLPMIL